MENTPQDCNNMYIGSYYLSNSEYLNMPTEDTGFLLSFGQSKDRMAQLYIDNAGRIYTRCFMGSGIKSWTGPK